MLRLVYSDIRHCLFMDTREVVLLSVLPCVECHIIVTADGYLRVYRTLLDSYNLYTIERCFTELKLGAGIIIAIYNIPRKYLIPYYFVDPVLKGKVFGMYRMPAAKRHKSDVRSDSSELNKIWGKKLVFIQELDYCRRKHERLSKVGRL